MNRNPEDPAMVEAAMKWKKEKNAQCPGIL